MTPEHDLLDTIEAIRVKVFPSIPPELVRQIIEIERDFTENRQEGYRRVSRVIDEYLARKAEV